MSEIRETFPTWFTIDIESLEDTNFEVQNVKSLDLDYEQLIDNWLEFCTQNSVKSTGFILGEFAKKYPQIVNKMFENGHEIACHGLNHELVYNLDFDVWREQTKEAKKILENITGSKVQGYRSPSWSLPFEDKYYEALIEMGFSYSSSYFPFKTYMYGHSEDKKEPFSVSTKNGEITEIPVPKNMIPFSGGFYLRVLPVFVQKILKRGLEKRGVKPVVYIHPYEMINGSFTNYYRDYFKLNKDFILAFFSTSNPKKKLELYV